MPDETPQTLVGIAFSDSLHAQEFLTAATRLAVNKQLVFRGTRSLSRRPTTGTPWYAGPSTRRRDGAALTSAMWTGLVGLLLAGPVGLGGGRGRRRRNRGR